MNELLMGSKCVIHTDYKFIVPLLTRLKGRIITTPRSMMLKLLVYDFTVEHISGKENPLVVYHETN